MCVVVEFTFRTCMFLCMYHWRIVFTELPWVAQRRREGRVKRDGNSVMNLNIDAKTCLEPPSDHGDAMNVRDCLF